MPATALMKRIVLLILFALAAPAFWPNNLPCIEFP